MFYKKKEIMIVKFLLIQPTFMILSSNVDKRYAEKKSLIKKKSQ